MSIRGLCLLGCTGFALGGLPAEASWDQFGGDTGNSRYVAGSQDLTKIAPAWSYANNYGIPSRGISEVAVDGERAYLTMLAGPGGGVPQLHAVDIITGERAWMSEIPNGHGSTASPPAIYGDSIYVNKRGHSAISGGTEAQHPRVTQFDRHTGELLSETRYADQWGSTFRPQPIAGAIITEGGYYGGTYGMDPDGGELWFNRNDFFIGSSQLFEHRLAGTDQFAVFNHKRFNPTTGVVTGQYTHPDGFNLEYPVIQGEALYYNAFDYRDDPFLYRLSRFDVNTASHAWDLVLDAPVRNMAAGPDRLAAVTYNRVIFADPSTGQIEHEWFQDLNQSYRDREIALTDSHFFYVLGESVYAYDIARRQVTWSRPSGQYAEIAVSDSFLFVSNSIELQAYRVAAPDPIAIAPTFDARATWNGASFDVNDGDDTMVADVTGFLDIDRRMLMEFDLASVPDTAVVAAASLGLHIGSYTSTINNGDQTFGSIELYAYAGDGTLSTADATAGLTLIGTSDEITTVGEITIDLDADVINTLLDGGAGILGLVGMSDSGEELFSAYTTEANAQFPDFFSAPELMVTFDWLPEVIAGDLNNDGLVTNADISALVLALTDTEAFAELYPVVDPDSAGDFTGDGAMTNADIAGFVELLTGGASPEAAALEQQILAQVNAVPEPGSLALLAIGGLLLSRRRPSGR